ncbi:MAG: hypothetical protein HYU70_00570 [Bacteroidetes bacterium]|nr:hypothetical protein [Bacteroidota bacterium]
MEDIYSINKSLHKTYIPGHGWVESEDYTDKIYVTGAGWVDRKEWIEPKLPLSPTSITANIGSLLTGYNNSGVVLNTASAGYVSGSSKEVGYAVTPNLHYSGNEVMFTTGAAATHNYVDGSFRATTLPLSSTGAYFSPLGKGVSETGVCITVDPYKPICSNYDSKTGKMTAGTNAYLSPITGDQFLVTKDALTMHSGTLSGTYLSSAAASNRVSESGVMITANAGYPSLINGAQFSATTDALTVNTHSFSGAYHSALVPSGIRADSAGYISANAFTAISSRHDYQSGIAITTNAGYALANIANPGFLVSTDQQKWNNDILSGSYIPAGIFSKTATQSFTSANGSVFITTAAPAQLTASGIALTTGIANTSRYADDTVRLTVDPLRSVRDMSGHVLVNGAYTSGAGLGLVSVDANKYLTHVNRGYGLTIDSSIRTSSGTYSDFGITREGRVSYRSPGVVIPQFEEPSITEEIEVDYTLARKLGCVHTRIRESYLGAVHVLNSMGPDYTVHMACSFRRAFTYIVDHLPNKTSLRDFFEKNAQKYADKKYKSSNDRNNSRIAFLFFTEKHPGKLTDDEFMYLIHTCNTWVHEYGEEPDHEQALDVHDRSVAILLHILEAHEMVNN